MNEFKGYTDGHAFRAANKYIPTQQEFEKTGLTDAIEKVTPTVGVNVAHLASMPAVLALSSELEDRPCAVTVLGISTAEGPRDFQKLLKGLGASHVSTTAIDISDGIFEDIRASGLDEVDCLQRDARDTGLTDGSQDIVLRDHIGNCCPPEIDRAIDMEASRIMRDGGIAVVNITTSDLLPTSTGRQIIPFEVLRRELGDEVIRSLQSGIYDLKEASELFPQISWDFIRGSIAEIEAGGSFVVFGEDPQGHGEWFRRLEDHRKTWEQDGFEVVAIATREGTDSHEPTLQCMRHNVLLRKTNTNSTKEI